MKVLLSAALLALAPITASALTVPVSVTGAGFDSFTAMLNPGDQVDFAFSVTPPAGYKLKFDFGLSGSGLYADVQDVTYSVDGSTPATWDSLDLIAGVVGAGSAVAGGPTTDSDFVVSFYDGVSNQVAVTMTYAASLVPVPVPAALPLLLAGLGALGVAGRARRKAA